MPRDEIASTDCGTLRAVRNDDGTVTVLIRSIGLARFALQMAPGEFDDFIEQAFYASVPEPEYDVTMEDGGETVVIHMPGREVCLTSQELAEMVESVIDDDGQDFDREDAHGMVEHIVRELDLGTKKAAAAHAVADGWFDAVEGPLCDECRADAINAAMASETLH